MTETPGELILIRHGRATPRQGTELDAQRELTKRGREELEKILPELSAHLNSASQFQLGTSPLPRAFQTAEIIGRYLGTDKIEQFDWIAQGEYTGLQERLKNLKPSSSLVIVGHEPHLGRWSRQFSGFTVPFKKAMAVGFRVTSLEPLRAWPAWMITPETAGLRDMDIEGGQPVLCAFQKILRFKLRGIFQMLQKFLDHPEDPETAHQLRVSIRAFRSLLSFIRPKLDQMQYQHVQLQTKKLSQRLGHLREIDILKWEWLKLRKTYPELTRKKSALLAVLETERQREQAEICGGAEMMLSAVFDIWNWLNGDLAAEAEEAKGQKQKQGQTFEDFSRKRIGSGIKKTAAYLKTADYTDFSNIHGLRIQFKKLRYVLKELDPLLHLKSKGSIKSFEALQDLFGSYCDAERNLALLNELNGRYADPAFCFESGILWGHQTFTAGEKLEKIKNFDGRILPA